MYVLVCKTKKFETNNYYVRNLLRGKVEMVIVYYCIIYDLLFSPFGNLMFDAALQHTVITPHAVLLAVSLSLSVFSTLLLCSLCP